ncbi:hypothetical protein RhiirC2_719050 [Rhizophagus irregularis]|uniref:Uncharacterized protein n=1 Tax=Rhizophagus irregularis TaxID=588596 RepID=A0A2N1MFT9_9GLOM|nr:hypothetical protein RhiirC2_719050 [Rhizophagus irregularis]
MDLPQNISGKNTLTFSPAPTAPSHIASSGNVDASMHAPLNKDKQQPLNALPDLDTNGAPFGDHTPDSVVTITIIRDDFHVAAVPNKALIEAVNNLFLETYESYTGKGTPVMWARFLVGVMFYAVTNKDQAAKKNCPSDT